MPKRSHAGGVASIGITRRMSAGVSSTGIAPGHAEGMGLRIGAVHSGSASLFHELSAVVLTICAVPRYMGLAISRKLTV